MTRRGSKHNLSREEWRSCAALYAARGSESPHAKLTEELVMEIRQTAGKVSAREWSKRTGQHVRTIEKVRSYETWRHVI